MKLTSSKRLNYLLGEMGIFTPYQVVEHLPRRYESFVYSPREALFHMVDKQKVVLLGTPIDTPKTLRFKGLSKSTFYFHSNHGLDFLIVAWNRPYLSKILTPGQEVTIQASYDEKGHCLNLLSVRKGRVPPEEAIIPVYSLPKDYPEHSFRALVKKSFEELEGKIYDVLPKALRDKYRFLSRFEALKRCHMPKDEEDVKQGLRVLKYEEALLFSLKNQLIRCANKTELLGKRPTDHEAVTRFVSSLPFALTASQKQAIKEGIRDMDAPSLMYRLLQGDVGMGKTMVATVLAYANWSRGMQTAVLAPTDSLARQHYENLVEAFKDTPIKVGLLVGAMEAKERKTIEAGLEDGSIDIAVGTHALFSQGIAYCELGLAIIDEQHKFGVNQRNLLASKGERADVYLMSATPIPRTLSLTIYGDLDVSTLTEYPGTKRNVTTKLCRPSSSIVAKAIDRCLELGKPIFAVAPRIEGEEGEDSVLALYEDYKKRYGPIVGLLHGRMDELSKTAAMLSLKSGLTKILVATSVIEVGIDIKKAGLMLIHSPESFSLSSLHQLRGRIGRDGEPSLCLLLYSGNDEDDMDKLGVLTSTEDGFRIAEEDLRRRGPGEMAGTRQSGLPDLRFANVIADFRMFEAARDDAAYLLANNENGVYDRLIEKAKKEMNEVSLA